jgi:hypothetical protein
METWIRELFFSGLAAGRTVELGDLLGEVYQTILAEGPLPTPPV